MKIITSIVFAAIMFSSTANAEIYSDLNDVIDSYIYMRAPYLEVKIAGCIKRWDRLIQCRIHAYIGSVIDVYTVDCNANGCKPKGRPARSVLI